MDRYKTFLASCTGGLNLNKDILSISQTPGAALTLVNFEPSISGGYRRINGYDAYSDTEVPGTGAVIGIAIFNSGVIACRDDEVYYGTGGSWGSPINSPSRTGAIRYRFTRYNWTGVNRIVMVDGTNKAARWDGTTYTVLSAAGSPSAPKFVEEFRNHIFFAGYSGNAGAVTFTAPNNENDYSGANGAGEIVVGDQVTGLRKFRDELYVFCRSSIKKITGTSLSNFAVVPVVSNIGCLETASDSIQEIAGDLVFLSPDGLRPVAATARIGDIEFSSISRPIQPVLISASNSNNITSLVVREKSQYRLFYNSSSEADTDGRGIIGAIIQHNDGSQGWDWSETKGIRPNVTDSGYVGVNELIIHGGYDGIVYQQELGNSFNGTNISAYYSTPYLFFDDPAMRKTLHTLHVYFTIEGATSIDGNILYDLASAGTIQPNTFTLDVGTGLALYDVGIFDVDVYGESQRPEVKTYINGSGLSAQLNFSSTDMASPYTINGYRLQYIVSGRR